MNTPALLRTMTLGPRRAIRPRLQARHQQQVHDLVRLVVPHREGAGVGSVRQQLRVVHADGPPVAEVRVVSVSSVPSSA